MKAMKKKKKKKKKKPERKPPVTLDLNEMMLEGMRSLDETVNMILSLLQRAEIRVLRRHETSTPGSEAEWEQVGW